MGRRRLVVFVIVLAAIALVATWWLSSVGLTAEERRLVGVWRTPMSTETPETMVPVFAADRRSFPAELRHLKPINETAVAWWWIRDGVIIYEVEPSRAKRLLRPVLRPVGVKVQPPSPVKLEWVSDDEIDFVMSTGYRDRRVRIRRD